MYKATFISSQSGGKQWCRIHVLLTDSTIDRLLGWPEQAVANTALLMLSEGVTNEHGETLAASVRWSSVVDGYALMLEGRQVGVIPMDELLAARQLDAAFVQDCTTCQVSFDVGGFSVWRNGLANPEMGVVYPLTATDAFNYLQPTLWLEGADINATGDTSLLVQLSPSDCRQPLVLTVSQMQWLADQGWGERRAVSPQAEGLDDLLGFAMDATSFVNDYAQLG